MVMMMVMKTLVIFLPGDLTLECEEDAERYQLKIEESLQVTMRRRMMMLMMLVMLMMQMMI